MLIYTCKNCTAYSHEPISVCPQCQGTSIRSVEETEEVHNIRQLAAAGDAKAQCSLGHRYSTGVGVPQDYESAAFWLERAARQNDPRAQALMGLCYKNGSGVPKDEAAAARWYQRSADQGYPLGEALLGLCHMIGAGVPQDEAKGVELYQKAAEKGNSLAGKGCTPYEKG